MCQRGRDPVEPRAFLWQELFRLGSGLSVHGDQRLPESNDHRRQDVNHLYETPATRAGSRSVLNTSSDVTSSSRCSKGSVQTRPEQTDTGRRPPPMSWTCGEGPRTPPYGYLKTRGSLSDRRTGPEPQRRSDRTHLRRPSTAAGRKGRRSNRWEVQGYLSPKRSDLSHPCWTFQSWVHLCSSLPSTAA